MQFQYMQEDRSSFMGIFPPVCTKRWISAIVLLFAFGAFSPSFAGAYSQAEQQAFQRSIVDYRSHLNPKYHLVRRRATRYIIVHTSELGRDTTLRVVSRGKQLRNGRCTYGGHANYVIARNGTAYRIMDKDYVADHAGLSMWNGQTDISTISIGIEMVGYHYAPLSDRQYRSVGLLIDILQKIYGLDDRCVLTHSQIAYGRPNRWFKRDHRGRKRCAKNFIRAKAGLGPTWNYDPDVRAGRLSADPQLAEVFYGRGPYYAEAEENDANIISKTNSAWSIAGEDYDSNTTVYKFPDGRMFSGDQIPGHVGWDRIPAQTVVLLNQDDHVSLLENQGPIKMTSADLTAWSLAGKAYNQKSTIYFLPFGQVKVGSTIFDWDDLPAKTQLIVGYQGPFPVDKRRSAYRIAGHKYKDPQTIYYLPSNQLLPGDQIQDFSRLPAGTLVFLPSS
jgi:N-acetylmuramoyl-L-alanine amidase